MLRLALIGVSFFAVSYAIAGAPDDFIAAEQALARGDRDTFERLSQGLQDYPLYPYLRFAQLTRDLDATADADIEAFLDDDPDAQLVTRLRRAYLRRLADAGRWSDYARVYRPDDSVERQCLYLRALIETGAGDAAMTQVAPLWRSGRSRPRACDPVFDAWREAGGLTPELTWQRIRLAMEAGGLGLARYLGQLLPEEERAWHARWLALAQDPAATLAAGGFDDPHPMRAAMLADGIARLARRSPLEAATELQRYASALAADVPASDRAHAAVGAALTATANPLGLRDWDAMGETASNLPEQERRLRAALALRAWDWVARWIERMPDGAVKRDRWLYWQGRAEAQLGRAREADALYAQAAKQRSFWGFMAADRIGKPYAMAHRSIPAEPERIRALVATPAFARMRELHRLGRETDLRREWRVFTQDMDAEDLMAAAYVADAYRWHDQAVFTQARTGFWDDLQLRFPLQHHALILEQAWQTGIEPTWILAILRQESVFAHTVASSAGAVGLMQLMPKTAVAVADRLGLDEPSRWDLIDPALNIALGSTYLAEMRDRFGHPALATAAYNAGPHRVERWLPSQCTDADLWIANIPFRETRGYVERVMAYRVIYSARLGEQGFRLSDWLPPISGEEGPQTGRVARLESQE
ncbi:transglycosylase SLT domain-containing protein [Thiocystis violacea]|uniref:transglycosylase SLT domain-containing protein n=1 Tax=Thiocystis violacea TaxID=13725 RepID=UPI0019030192|nr:transglycosylase SLT domain-containing protein [Thiocystis violacea]MBK1724868.1 lytic murein transglycosylase [Thiocystis violacea]